MNKDFKGVTVILITIITVALSVFLIALPKKDFSEKENRYLSKWPEFNIKTLVNGEYLDGINDYVTDHFPGRDAFIALRTSYRLMTGANCINNIYVGHDGYLMEKYEKPKNVDKFIDTVNKFSDNIEAITDEDGRDISINLMVVPTAITIYENKLPLGAGHYSQLEVLDKIYGAVSVPCIDVYSALRDNGYFGDDVTLFYRTDHHWSPEGAYLGYVAFCKATKADPIDINDMDVMLGTKDFHGTYSSKVQVPFEKGDIINLYTDKNAKLNVWYTDDDKYKESLFATEYLDKKDKYSVFLDNIHSLIVVENENATTKRELVLIKDSYANSMMPYLIHNFSKIYVFDTRHYKNGVSEFIKEHEGVSDILILYNLATMDTDTGIRGIY